MDANDPELTSTTCDGSSNVGLAMRMSSGSVPLGRDHALRPVVDASALCRYVVKPSFAGGAELSSVTALTSPRWSAPWVITCSCRGSSWLFCPRSQETPMPVRYRRPCSRLDASGVAEIGCPRNLTVTQSPVPVEAVDLAAGGRKGGTDGHCNGIEVEKLIRSCLARGRRWTQPHATHRPISRNVFWPRLASDYPVDGR